MHPAQERLSALRGLTSQGMLMAQGTLSGEAHCKNGHMHALGIGEGLNPAAANEQTEALKNVHLMLPLGRQLSCQ